MTTIHTIKLAKGLDIIVKIKPNGNYLVSFVGGGQSMSLTFDSKDSLVEFSRKMSVLEEEMVLDFIESR